VGQVLPCKKCGDCCRSFNNIPRQHLLQADEQFAKIYPESVRPSDLDRGDGTCKFLDEKTNMCKIYDHRPALCDVTKVFHVFSDAGHIDCTLESFIQETVDLRCNKVAQDGVKPRKTFFKRHPKFPCQACGVCCDKVFKEIPTSFPELNKIVAKLDRGDGVCKNFDEETRRCRIYKKRPWFCNGIKIWKKYFKPQGLSLEYAYSLMEKQCLALKTKGTVTEEDLHSED